MSSKLARKRKHDAQTVQRETEDFPWEHQKRFAKLQSDQFYLLSSNVGDKDKSLCFDVSGSTGNVYRVNLPGRGRRFSCTCPDASSHARRNNVECKHVLFVVYRVLRSSLSPQHFADEYSRCIGDKLFDEWVERAQVMQTLLLSNSSASDSNNHDPFDIINEEYRQRFLSARDGTDNAKSKDPPGVVCASEFKGRCGDEDCPICFMPILESDEESVAQRKKENIGKKPNLSPNGENMLVQCGTCLRALHRECADQWIDVGHNETCVYCRSTLPYARWRVSSKKQTERRSYSSVSTNAYFNVAD